MALRPDDPRLEIQEDGGGAVKTFLEHLEDLRWCLVKCAAVVGIGMVVCLAGADHLMKLLKRPLLESGANQPGKNQKLLLLYAGTNVIGKSFVRTNEFGNYDLGTTNYLQLQLVPRLIGTNWLMSVEPFTDPPKLPEETILLINQSPVGGFVVAFKVAMYGGLVLASPFVFYFILQFALPAMKQKEKKYGGRALSIAVVLFLLGVMFCYFFLMPFALAASAKYSNWLGLGADWWTAESYISFVCMFMVGMGLGFEMPVVILLLVKIGIVDYKALAGFRKYMVVINLVLGAVLTTPEIITQILMFVPLQLLYELSVWIAWYWERRDRKAAEKLGDADKAK
ncbi:MAG: twin-arginine translocase subunit TatC [Verrucomicrobia bacterium]|nr:twin-arginine translocase subunit TatC [Verrucomicrobiota bacterium]